jgi:hypothetical protein
LLGGEQDHLGASPEPHLAGGALQFFQFGELFGGEIGDAYGFHGLLLRPQPTPLGIYLSVLRITEEKRSKIIALVAKDPPGKLLTCPDGVLGAEDESKAAYWTLDALAEAAQQMGIEVRRSQVRRILLAEGVRWRQTRPWAESVDPEFVPKGRRSSSSTPRRPRTPPWSAWMNSVPSPRAPFLLLRDGHRTDAASKRPSNTVAGQTRRGCSAPCGFGTVSR